MKKVIIVSVLLLVFGIFTGCAKKDLTPSPIPEVSTAPEMSPSPEAYGTDQKELDENDYLDDALQELEEVEKL